jgi:predicted bacteriocin transport accessory protein
MKKLPFLAFFLIPILAGCAPEPISKVVIPFSDEIKSGDGELIELESYYELVTKVTNEETFLFVVGNSTCLCTLDFTPVLSQWIEQTHVPVYYMEYTLLLFQDETYGIPMQSASTPILTIFNEGELAFFHSYSPSNRTRNELFYNIELLTSWFNQRLILPTFHFLTKANFDTLFLQNKRFMIYIGREDCPDCSFAFQSFVVPFLKESKGTLPPIYGLDVMLNGIRNPQITGQEETTGNNTPGWEEFKTNYGLNNVLNTTFGYHTGFVPTFMIINGNGQSIQEDPSIIEDMLVVYNDSSVQNPLLPYHAETNPRITSLTRTFFDGTRPLAYTDVNLTTITLPVHTTGTELRFALENYHSEAMQDFFEYYLPLL